jgi:hypothetical protein
MRKIAVTASASGSGKSTVGRALAKQLGVPYVELDALVHGPNWTETPDDELRRILEPVLASEGWVIDGGYRRKIGDLVFEQADVVVWIDLPIHVWLPRLIRRTVRRWRHQEELWNGNRESLRDAIGGRDALIPYAVRSHFSRPRRYPAELERFNVVRLRTQPDVDAFVRDAGAL